MLRPPLRILLRPLSFTPNPGFYTSTSTLSKNRIYDSIRNEADFHTALRLSATAGIPLITMWTTSYCPSCRTVKPILKDIVERRDGKSGAVDFAEVELDAPGGGMGELGYRYTIRSLPTLLVFNHGELVDEKRLTDTRIMTDQKRLKGWVDEVAKEGESKGISGESWVSGVFG